MKIPRRFDYYIDADYLAAMDQWCRANDAAYLRLRGMFDATPEFSAAPEFSDDVRVMHVAMASRPADENLEPVLKALASSIMDDGCDVARIHHGYVDRSGEKIWRVLAELKAA